MLSRQTQIATVLLCATIPALAIFLYSPCPKGKLPAVYTTGPPVPATVIRVVEHDSIKLTCARACDTKGIWSMRIPKYKKAVYFPERKSTSSQLPKQTTASLIDNDQCIDCRGNDVTIKNKLTFYSLELSSIDKDLNETKIYCGQTTSAGTTFVDIPITLFVYHSDAAFEKLFRTTHRESTKVKKPRGYDNNDSTLLNQLRRGNVTLQVVVYLIWLVFVIFFSFILIRVIGILSKDEPPGVRFIGKVYTTTIQHWYEKTVHWPEAGIKLLIPQGTVAIGQKSVLRCRQAISGPFVAPPGQTFASVFYYITVSQPLLREIELTLPHAANLKSQRACHTMQFLRASSRPIYNEHGSIEYRFGEVNAGTFSVHRKEGKIHLRDFSFWCCSTSNSKNLDYLVKLVSPKEPLLPTPHAIYAVSLATPALDKFFDDLLEREHPKEHFKCAEWRQVNFESDSNYAEIELPQKITDRKYTAEVIWGTKKITKKMADMPTRNEEYLQHFSRTYPPRAVLEFSAADPDNPPTKPLQCNFKVTVNTDSAIDGIQFKFSLPKLLPQQPAIPIAIANGVSKANPTNILETEPTMKYLQLIKWHDQGQDKELRIIERASNKWTEIGDQFEIDRSVLAECEERWRENSKRFRSVLEKWLNKECTSKYKRTWSGLIEVLEDVKHSALADDLAVALKSMKEY